VKRLKGFLDKLFGTPETTRHFGQSARGPQPPAPESDSAAMRLRATPYQKGDFIGQRYEVLDLLGEGGFGVVYKVYSHEVKEVLAVKTFRDEYLNDATARELFRREAQVWVDMDRCPHLVRAYYIEEISHRLYIIMEYIAPDQAGLNSLEGYVKLQPPDLIQSLRWAIQFCYGMEYAYSKGLRCHRDIKPSNIMVGSNKTVKISDFGLAGLAADRRSAVLETRNIQPEVPGSSRQTIPVGGTLTHMSPEQFTEPASCDEKSDIYSFGVVLYQMASRRLPFDVPPSSTLLEKGWGQSEIMWKLHSEAPVPPLNSKLFPVIQHCLEKKPQKRYESFRELRKDLEVLLERYADEKSNPPVVEELKGWEWGLKGASLNDLGRFEEALLCHDAALAANPGPENAIKIFKNKATALRALNRLDEALQCCDRALALDPRYSEAWSTKGNILGKMERFADSLDCYNRAIVSEAGNAVAWNNKASALQHLGRLEEALPCHDRALQLDPRNATFWTTKGSTLSDLRRFEEALPCFAKANKLDPKDLVPWFNRGAALHHLGHLEEAIGFYERALELAPRYGNAWFYKACAEEKLDRTTDAAHSYGQVILAGDTSSPSQVEYARKRVSELRGGRQL
jgi:serine/threonine protein kinase